MLQSDWINDVVFGTDARFFEAAADADGQTNEEPLGGGVSRKPHTTIQ